MRGITRTAVAFIFMAAAGAAQAGPAEQAAIEAGCHKSTNWGDQACKCVATEAASLTETQQAFLAAMLEQDKAATSGLLTQMTHPEMMEVASFMTKAGPGCQGG